MAPKAPRAAFDGPPDLGGGSEEDDEVEDVEEEGEDGSLESSPLTAGWVPPGAPPGAFAGRAPGMVPLTVGATEIVGVAVNSVGVVPETVGAAVAVVAVVTGAASGAVVVVVVVVVVGGATGTGLTSTLPQGASKEYQCVKCSKS